MNRLILAVDERYAEPYFKLVEFTKGNEKSLIKNPHCSCNRTKKALMLALNGGACRKKMRRT